MTSQTDQQLLRDYAASRSEPAFTELVRRHVDLVYSAALRMVRDAHLAQDVTQGAFLALAQNASQLADRPVISGWLHRTAQNLASKTIRTEVRRRAREQESAAMKEPADDAWETIAPHLDAVLTELNDADRDALMLRYFERKSAQEMASLLGVSAEAAQKRVTRSVERLRDLFAKRGITAGAGGIAAVVSANAVQSAPIGLAASIATAATVNAFSTSVAVATTIAMTTLQKMIVAAVIAAALGTGVYQYRQAAHWREQFQQAQQDHAAEMQRLQRENEAASNRLAVLAKNTAKVTSDNAELLKLRSELTRLRGDEEFGTGGASMKKWLSNVALLKQKLEQMPNRKIPELQFATEKNWADAAWNADLSTEDGVRQALSKLREDAINKFLNEMMKDAMKKYLAANNNIAPASLSDLKSYFDAPVTDEMLSHYKLLQTGTVDNSADLVQLTAHADDDYDSNHAMSINGAWGGGYNRAQDAVLSAAKNFLLENGQSPTAASQLQAYLKQPIDPATVQKYIDQNQPPPEVAIMTPALQAYAAANNGKFPVDPDDIFPYITTPQEMTALKKMSPDIATISPAIDAYSAADNGQLPHAASDLAPYLTNDQQKSTYQKLIKSKSK